MTTWVLEQEVFSDFDAALGEAFRRHGDRVVAWNDEWWASDRWPELATR